MSYNKNSISYLVSMFVLVNKYLILRRFDGVVLWPFIFLRRPDLKNNKEFMNHERVHLHQQKEMLVLLFYIWYAVEFFLRYLEFDNAYEAYRNISFEREAYSNEDNLDYLKNRRAWAFLKYL